MMLRTKHILDDHTEPQYKSRLLHNFDKLALMQVVHALRFNRMIPYCDVDAHAFTTLTHVQIRQTRRHIIHYTQLKLLALDCKLGRLMLR